MTCGNPFKHAIEDAKETFSKSCGVPIQGNDWCGLVSNYETDLIRSITRMSVCSLESAQWTTEKKH